MRPSHAAGRHKQLLEDWEHAITQMITGPSFGLDDVLLVAEPATDMVARKLIERSRHAHGPVVALCTRSEVLARVGSMLGPVVEAGLRDPAPPGTVHVLVIALEEATLLLRLLTERHNAPTGN